MRKFNVFSFVVLVLLTPLVLSQEECDTDSRTERSESINVLDFAAVLTVPIPESCGDFQATSLLQCQPELNILEGCCVSACRDLLAQYSATCLQDLAAVICDSGTPGAVEILDAVTSRCDDDYEPLSCNSIITPSTESPVPSPSTESPASSPGIPPVAEQASVISPSDSEQTVEPVGEPMVAESSLPEQDMEDFVEQNLMSLDPVGGDPGACLKNRVTDPNVETAEFLPLLTSLTLPKSCGNFTAADLLQCREELEILSGCCNPTCISTFAEVPLRCLTDLSQILCDDYTNLLLPLSRVALRCKENFQGEQCEALPLEVVVDENGLQTLTTDVHLTQDNNGALGFQILTRGFLMLFGVVFLLV